MAQYPIPQFIEAEGKIISFLTFRQFFILVGGGVLCFILYYVLPFWLFTIFAVIIGLLAAAIAFLKVDGVSVVTLLLNFVGFSIKSKNYTWKKKESLYPFRAKEHQIGSVKGLGEASSEANKLQDIKKMVELRKK